MIRRPFFSRNSWPEESGQVTNNTSPCSSNSFRLRYRNELAGTVAAVVRGGQRADEAAIHAVMPVTVAEDDQTRFVALT